MDVSLDFARSIQFTSSTVVANETRMVTSIKQSRLKITPPRSQKIATSLFTGIIAQLSSVYGLVFVIMIHRTKIEAFQVCTE